MICRKVLIVIISKFKTEDSLQLQQALYGGDALCLCLCNNSIMHTQSRPLTGVSSVICANVS